MSRSEEREKYFAVVEPFCIKHYAAVCFLIRAQLVQLTDKKSVGEIYILLSGSNHFSDSSRGQYARTDVMDEYSLLTSEERSENVENPTCFHDNSDENQSWEELSLISDDDEFSVLSSDVEELSQSEIGHGEAEEICNNDSPCYSPVSDDSTLEESLSDHEVLEDQPSQSSSATNQRKRQHAESPIFHPTTKVPEALSVESDSDDSSVDSNTAECPSAENAKKSKEARKRKKDKGIQYYSLLT